MCKTCRTMNNLGAASLEQPYRKFFNRAYITVTMPETKLDVIKIVEGTNKNSGTNTVINTNTGTTTTSGGANVISTYYDTQTGTLYQKANDGSVIINGGSAKSTDNNAGSGGTSPYGYISPATSASGVLVMPPINMNLSPIDKIATNASAGSFAMQGMRGLMPNPNLDPRNASALTIQQSGTQALDTKNAATPPPPVSKDWNMWLIGGGILALLGLFFIFK